jgi:hypothetical protein
MVDLPTSISDGSLSVQQTSVPESTKPSHDSSNSHAPIHLKSEVRMSSAADSTSDYAAMVSELVSYKKRYKKAEEGRLFAEKMWRQFQSLGQMSEDVTSPPSKHSNNPCSENKAPRSKDSGRISILQQRPKCRVRLTSTRSFIPTPKVSHRYSASYWWG